MTKNSPKFVEVVGAILITVGFLILGKPRKHRYNIFSTASGALVVGGVRDIVYMM